MKELEVKREEICNYYSLDTDDLRDVCIAIASHLNLKIIRVTNEEWPPGHSDRVTFEIEKIYEDLEDL